MQFRYGWGFQLPPFTFYWPVNSIHLPLPYNLVLVTSGCRFDTRTPEIEKWIFATVGKMYSLRALPICNEHVPFLHSPLILMTISIVFFPPPHQFFLPARPWFGYLSVLHNANQRNRFNHSRLICYPPPICVCRWMFRLWKSTNKLPMRSLTI